MCGKKYHREVDLRPLVGQIGSAINEVLDPLEMEVFNTDKEELDITDTDEVLNFGVINRPDVIINCAAVTDTDLCEKEPELAYRVNALGARNLSIVARKTWAKMVQISTDDVFDGIRHTSISSCAVTGCMEMAIIL